MGQEIEHSQFSDGDFQEFKQRLSEETDQLIECLGKQRVDSQTGTCGLELEGCLIDDSYRPAPENARFIEQLDNPLVVPELATFNFEINTPPCEAEAGLFSALEAVLDKQWQHCRDQARSMGLDICQIGILPTLRDSDLTLANVSGQQRYIALNQQILKGRQFQPFVIDIAGEVDRLHITQRDVMTEAATTSLQIHLQVAPNDFCRFYNACLLASAPLVAACANSPLCFGKALWEETRIPLFEQSVAVPCFISGDGAVVHRVCFGSDYAHHAATEIFQENLQAFPILLPILYEDTQTFPHLQLHNGTIWRWNRPLIHRNANDQVQLRIEHRAIPAGPTVTDDIANIALFYGLVGYLANTDPVGSEVIGFASARENFYRAARDGLKGDIVWSGNQRVNLQQLLLNEILPAARTYLLDQGFNRDDVDYYLGEVIGERIRRGQTGAHWQRHYFEKHRHNLHKLMKAYQRNGERGPVYQW